MIAALFFLLIFVKNYRNMLQHNYCRIAGIIIAIFAITILPSCRDMLMTQAAEKINAKCPTKQFKGFTLNSVVYQDDTFIFDFKVDDSTIKDFFDNLGLDESLFYLALDLFADQITAKGSVKNCAKTLVDLAGKDENYKTLIDLCVSEKVNAKFNLHIGQKQKSLFITSQDISDSI